MGTDIKGWVEVRAYERWASVIRIQDIMGRSYDAFGCLFGTMNMANFRPLAAGRGLPDDVAEDTLADSVENGPDLLEPTWIGWDELAQIDLDEPALDYDRRYTEYFRDSGLLIKLHKSGMHRAEMERLGSWDTGLDKDLLPEIEFEHEGFVYRRERMTRREALDTSWTLLFTLMATLAVRYGASNVRLVVWFIA